MARQSEKNLIVGLDIGTSKIMAIVGDVGADGEINVLGIGSSTSRGLKRGVVVNIDSTIDAIQKAINDAEMMADCQIHSAYTSISGSHISSLNSHGVVAIRNREVTQADIDRVIEAAKAVAMPADQQVLHILPQEFIIDGQTGIKEPLGMTGVRLEVKVHIVTASISATQNVAKCVRQCGVEIADIVLSPLAASNAVLSDDEKELGVCVVDIGGGTTDIAIYTEGSITHSASIPVAGDQVTNDVAVALRVPAQLAEEIKVKNACTVIQTTNGKEMINIPGAGNRTTRSVPQKALAEVVEARYEEILELVNYQIQKSGLANSISAGIVLTGGAINLPGIVELTESILGKSVRRGKPRNATGMTDAVENPGCATAMGLIVYGYQQSEQEYEGMMPGTHRNIWGRMRSWFQGNF